jgi:cytochrome c biogenesis protein CcmG/thiol:disulfide interchange protein DsbE
VLVVGVAALLTIAVVVGGMQLVPRATTVGAHPLEGKPAPELDLERVGAEGVVSLAQLRGHPVVINFWAPSCVPCRREFPALKSALAAHRAQGLLIVGVWFRGGSFLDSPDDVTKFIADQGADWATFADPGARVQAAYDVVVPPTTFFVDRDGVVRVVQLGEMTGDLLERHLARIL